MRWAEHVARTGSENGTKFLLESLNGRDHSEDVGVGGRIILKWILGKYGLGCGLGSCGSWDR
jgi:hypothetical protein